MKKLLSIFLLVLTIMPTSFALGFGAQGNGPSNNDFGRQGFKRSFRAVKSVDNSYISPINSVNVVQSNNTYNSNYNYHYNAENTQVLRPVTANSFGNKSVNNTWKYKSFTQRSTNSYKAYHRNNNYARPTRYYYTSVYYYTPVTYYYSW